MNLNLYWDVLILQEKEHGKTARTVWWREGGVSSFYSVSMNSGGVWVYELWKEMVYVFPDMIRKHYNDGFRYKRSAFHLKYTDMVIEAEKWEQLKSADL